MRVAYQDCDIKLIVLFTDGDDNPIDPSTGPFVDIFDPDNNPASAEVTDADALVLNASQVSLGETGQQGTAYIVKEDMGLYSYIYRLTPTSDAGTWYDRWSATIDAGEVETTFEFSVLEKVSASSIELGYNMRVTVVLDSSIANTDGETLGEDCTYWFSTILTPMYSSTEMVAMEVAAWIPNLPTETIELAILNSSIQAEELTFADITNTEYYEHIRREFSTVLAALSLVSSSIAGATRYKRLADLEVSWDTRLQERLEELRKRADELKRLLNAGGAIAEGGSLAPQRTIRGQLFKDRPAFGRGWTRDTSLRPGSNARKYTDVNKRRVIHTWDDNPPVVIKGPNWDSDETA